MSQLDDPPALEIAGTAGKASVAELVGTLSEQLDRAAGVVGDLRKMVAAGAASSAPEPSPELLARMRALEEDRDLLASHLVDAEKQGSRVMSLYVVTYQLHASLEPEEVEAIISEIAVDLLGAESFVLLLRDEGSDRTRIAGNRGVEALADAKLFAADRYDGGHSRIDEALRTGQMYVGEELGEATLAVVPFSIHGRVLGALAVFRLLSHRSRPLSEERELLDLVAAHSASALVAARAFAAATRKLRTLESLIALLGTGEDGSAGGGGRQDVEL